MRLFLHEPILFEGDEDNRRAKGPIFMIFNRFREGFRNRGHNLLDVEDDINFLIRNGIKIKKENPEISRVDIIARILEGTREDHSGGHSFSELYLIQKASNAISETFGHNVNYHRAGVRSQLGPMSLEDGLRLRCIPPIESQEVTNFLQKELVPIWKSLGGQLARGLTSGKAAQKKHTILPIGSLSGQETSKALFRKRVKMQQYQPLLKNYWCFF